MNQKAFLLGFFSIAGQILLLREVVSSLHGNELFIGTAFCGWMITISIGAGIGGRGRWLKSTSLFIIGLVLLPASIVAIRLMPTLFISVPGQYLPFYISILISMVVMIPISLISGMLFPVISNEGHRPAASIARVYLFEGLGAFLGGALMAVSLGWVVSSLQAGFIIALVVISALMAIGKRSKYWYLFPAVLILAVVFYGNIIDKAIDRVRYDPYTVEDSFDTRYTHQTILARENNSALLTDNKIEIVFPDELTAENLIIPPLLYHENARMVLYFGRPEWGVSEIVSELAGIKLEALDPRDGLTARLADNTDLAANVSIKHQDPIKYARESGLRSVYDWFDIIVLNPGDLSRFRSARYPEESNLIGMKSMLKDDGVLFYPTSIDTDRHISDEKRQLLSVIYGTLKREFRHVHVWPGEMTLFFASDSLDFKLPYDSLIDHLSSMSYRPDYVNENYLFDRLDSIKTARLIKAVTSDATINTIDRPRIIPRQLKLNAMLSDVDRNIISLLYDTRWVVIIAIIIIAGILIVPLFFRQRRRVYALPIYFIAGLVSLSLELITFYLYQSTVGALYSDMAILIGIFMLGLAVGTYYSLRLNKENLEIPALLLLVSTSFMFYILYERVFIFILPFYAIFLFVVSVATGSLFVAATDRYYYGKSRANRGLGYAFEIGGSALAALVTTTILLTIIGLPTLMISIIVITGMTLIGAMVTIR